MNRRRDYSGKVHIIYGSQPLCGATFTTFNWSNYPAAVTCLACKRIYEGFGR